MRVPALIIPAARDVKVKQRLVTVKGNTGVTSRPADLIPGELRVGRSRRSKGGKEKRDIPNAVSQRRGEEISRKR